MFKLILLALAACLQVANCKNGSHVLQFGDLSLTNKHLDFFMGTSGGARSGRAAPLGKLAVPEAAGGHASLPQHEADLMYFRNRVSQHPEGSAPRAEAQRALERVKAKRAELDSAFESIRAELKRRNLALNEVRPPGAAVVDDWDCYRSAIASFQNHCGKLNEYGLSKVGLLASACNSGILARVIDRICSVACPISLLH